MLRPIRTIFLLVFLSLSGWSGAQTLRQFSGDPMVFTDELGQIYSNVSNERALDEISAALSEFTYLWNSARLTEDERIAIISMANALLSSRLKSYPDLSYYISNLSRLSARGDRDALIKWLSSLDHFIQFESLRKIQEYLKVSNNFLTGGILYKSSSYTWRVTDSAFVFEFDTVPRYLVKNTRLVCSTSKDSSVVSSTSGIYYPTRELWEGEKGKVTWWRFNFSEDSIYTFLRNYSVDVRYSDFKADSVVFYNKKYFREPMLGTFEDKVYSNAPNDNTSYPRFSSYLKNYEIRNLFKKIDYMGGWTMQGAKVIGTGALNEYATITISRQGKKIIEFRSLAFYIEGDRVSSNPATFLMIVDGDSIHHPGLQMKYLNETRELSLYKPNEGIARSPFFNTYHRVDIDCNALYWNIDDGKVKFESLRGINRASNAELRSDDFFSKDQFYRIQGIDDRNPLYTIYNFYKTFSTREVRPGMLAEYMKMPEEQVKALLIRLSIQGFLDYDMVNGTATIQDRLFHYIESNGGRDDYDVIRIFSQTYDEPNAELDLNNLDLLVRGVEEVFLSDSQNVIIYPSKKEIMMKKGMDFVFTGNIHAGLFDFYARECSFEYDSFRLNLPTIDSMSFQVKSFEKDENGEYQLVRVKNVVEDLTGTIYIDHPENKSGLKDFPRYPIFSSNKESYVYYDKNPRYGRDLFKYNVAPFEIDSLNDFVADNMRFDGYLSSGGILPDIKEALKVQPDYSLGFLNESPEEGYPVYGGKGRFNNDVDLSNLGLRARGKLTYLTSTIHSDEFIFFPDEMDAKPVKTLQIREKSGTVEYPFVTADTVDLAWYPYQDSMVMKQMREPIMMFHDQAELSGVLTYTDKMMTGKGKMVFENSIISADKFRYGRQTIDSDSVNFSLLSKDAKTPAISSRDFRAHVDLSERTLALKSNKDGSSVSFPFNKVIGRLDNINWEMDSRKMKITNNLNLRYPGIESMTKDQLMDLKITGADLISINPDMDSLSFFCSTVTYDLDNYLLSAEDVKLIKVADAGIFPDSARMTIMEGGKISPLTNAEIIVDTASRLHQIYNADLTIKSRSFYEGSGVYHYIGIDKRIQEIPMDLISVDTAGRTIGYGNVALEDAFTLSPYFAFYGDVSLLAGNPSLMFEGGFRTIQDCYKFAEDNWIYFHNEIDPLNVRIDLAEPPVSIDGQELELSLLVSDYEEGVYASFFDVRKMEGDTSLYDAAGSIMYDTLARSFRIFREERYDPAVVDEQMTLNTRSCLLETSGRHNLGISLGYVDITAFGDSRYMIVPDSAEFSLTITFDFLMEENSMGMMADSLVLSNLKGIDLGHARFMPLFREYLGAEGADKLKEDIGVYGTLRKLPDELEHTLVLTDVKMFWSSATRSYVSRGPIGVLGIGKTPVARYVKGYVELLKRRSGDGLTIYLELDPMHYYFFDYQYGIMQVISSDEAFNERIMNMKESKRRMSKSGMEEEYEYVISTRSKVVDFIRSMESLGN